MLYVPPGVITGRGASTSPFVTTVGGDIQAWGEQASVTQTPLLTKQTHFYGRFSPQHRPRRSCTLESHGGEKIREMDRQVHSVFFIIIMSPIHVVSCPD